MVRNGLNQLEKKVDDTAVSFEDALTLTGFGRYNIILLLVCTNVGLAVGLDLMWSTFVVPAASCDLELNVEQRGIISAVPFAGVITMSHLWGYLSDIKGRKFVMLISTLGSFVASFISSFSPNWIALMVLRYLSICFTSASNALMFTLVAESCPQRWRVRLLLLVSTALMGVQVPNGILAYLILPLGFRIPIPFLGIIYRSWRLLVQCMSLFTGVSAIAISFMYESPKFLAAHGRNEDALRVLRGIYAKNTGDTPENYPVKTLLFDELHSKDEMKMSFLHSVWSQTIVLFKPPLLWNTIRLYYIAFILYMTLSSYFIWISFILDGYFVAVENNVTSGLCGLMDSAYSTGNMTNQTTTAVECSDEINSFTIFTTCTICAILVVINIVISFIPRKRVTLVVVLLIGGLCGVGTNAIPEPTVALFCFVAYLCTSPALSIVSAYFAELFPTNVRGMASCLGVLVGRSSTLMGSYVLGLIIEQHCALSFYVTGGLVLSCAFVAFTLPSATSRKADKPS